MAAPCPIKPAVTASVLKNSISRHNACRLNFCHFRSAFSPTIPPSLAPAVDLPRSRIPPSPSSGDSPPPPLREWFSLVFHLRAKYLARRRRSEGEKRQGCGTGRGRGGRREGARAARKKGPASPRAFPRVRTKGATLDRLGGTRAERKRVVGHVEALKKASREEREIDFSRRGAPVFSNFRARARAGGFVLSSFAVVVFGESVS